MDKKINKTDLVKMVASQTKKSQYEVAEIVDSLFDTMQDEIIRGNIVQVLGFGKFDVIRRRARNATNPKTGKLISIPEKRAVRFKSGTMLKVK